MTPIELPYDEIWLHDFEYVPLPGEHPQIVCLVAHELRSGRTLSLGTLSLANNHPIGPMAACCSSIL